MIWRELTPRERDQYVAATLMGVCAAALPSAADDQTTPAYTRDILAARAVIVRIEARQAAVFVALDRSWETGLWTARFRLDQPGPVPQSAWRVGVASTPAEAICLAALAVVQESPAPRRGSPGSSGALGNGRGAP